jgi:competence protein ComEC
MARRSVITTTFLTAALVAGCGGRATRSPPPPRGTSYETYLGKQPRPAPTAPAGTAELEAVRLHVIDVGQGSATLVETPCGAALIDTGGELNDDFDGVAALTRYLDAFFARRPDLRKRLALLVISHPHIDHTRGIATVLARYKVANVVDNGDVREEVGGFEQIALHEWLQRHPNVGHVDVAEDDIGDRGLTSPVIDPIGTCDGAAIDPVIRLLSGGRLGKEEVGHDPNDDSVVVRIDFGEASFLATGDIGRLGIAHLLKRFASNPALLDVDVLIVPHHGSKHSAARALTEKVSPELAIISAGPYDRSLGTQPEYTARAFGHPSKIIVDELAGAVTATRRPARVMVGLRGAWKATPSEWAPQVVDKAIYATSWDGDIVVTARANGWLEVTTSRPAAP